MNLGFILNRLESSEKRVSNFINNNIVDWSEQEILTQAQKKGTQFGLSTNAANGMLIEKTGFMTAALTWEYRGPNNEPLHQFLENGFSPHTIEAKGKDFGGADVLSWLDKSGTRVFRRRVEHPGFEGYHILRDTWNDKKPLLTRRIITEVNNFLEASRL